MRVNSNVRRMQRNRLPALASALCIGVATAWAFPSEWFVGLFLSGIAATLLLFILAAVGAGQLPPFRFDPETITYFLLGTSQPTAIVRTSLALVAFQVLAAYVAGMALGMVWLANA
jgi:ABC-type uncharacterized transport system permease subunit